MQLCHDANEEVRAVWRDAWETLTPTHEQTLRLYAAEITKALTTSMESSAWTAKRQAAQACRGLLLGLAVGGASGADVWAASGADVSVQATDFAMPTVTDVEFNALLADAASRALATGGSASAATPAKAAALLLTLHSRRALPAACVELYTHAPSLLSVALTSLGGRLWDGKDALCVATAELCGRCAPVCATAVPGSRDALSALLAQCQKGTATEEYTTAALSSCALVAGTSTQLPADMTLRMWSVVSPHLVRHHRAAGPLPDTMTPSFDASGAAGGGGALVSDEPAATVGKGGGATALMGGKMDEDKQSASRIAAKDAWEAKARLLCACYSVLAASVPSLAVYTDAGGAAAASRSLDASASPAVGA
ncbi:MAG: hypothetical protein EOO41_02710, partial [Methanobacteriota archaeon]